jgi:hypothetical protein
MLSIAARRTVMDTWSGSVRPQCVSMMPCQISLGAQHAPAAGHTFVRQTGKPTTVQCSQQDSTTHFSQHPRWLTKDAVFCWGHARGVDGQLCRFAGKGVRAQVGTFIVVEQPDVVAAPAARPDLWVHPLDPSLDLDQQVRPMKHPLPCRAMCES